MHFSTFLTSILSSQIIDPVSNSLVFIFMSHLMIVVINIIFPLICFKDLPIFKPFISIFYRITFAAIKCHNDSKSFNLFSTIISMFIYALMWFFSFLDCISYSASSLPTHTYFQHNLKESFLLTINSHPNKLLTSQKILSIIH